VVLAGHRAHVERRVGAVGHHVELRLAVHRRAHDGGREPGETQGGVRAQARLLLGLERVDRAQEALQRHDRVHARVRHRAVRHHAVHVHVNAQGALLVQAQLELLGFADDRAVHLAGPSLGDEVFDARHHPLLVDDEAQAQASGEVGGGALQRGERRDGGGDAGLHVGAAAAVEPLAAARVGFEVGAVRVAGPAGAVALGDHVGVALEHQRAVAPGDETAPLPVGDHVRPPRAPPRRRAPAVRARAARARRSRPPPPRRRRSPRPRRCGCAPGRA
jgi:hypothetical protein